ncbi:MAG: hypothetical protein LBI73_01830 [Myroides sp.]|nr:hypothetical protein [Myroides sp.]
MKELAKVAEEQKQDATKKLCSISFSILFFYQESKVNEGVNDYYIKRQKDSFYQLITTQLHIDNLLHPPLYV